MILGKSASPQHGQSVLPLYSLLLELCIKCCFLCILLNVNLYNTASDVDRDVLHSSGNAVKNI